MNAEAATALLTNTEFLPLLAALLTALYAKVHREFPAVVCFLVLRTLISGGYSLLNTWYAPGSPGFFKAYSIYFDFFWAAYFLMTLAVFFSIEQIIRRVLTPLPGLSKLGVVIFRFTGILTLFIALTAHISEMRNISFEVWMQALYVSFALCMCVFEVTLMGLLIATAQRFGLSFRTRILGLSLGFCTLGVVDFTSLVTLNSVRVHWAGLSLGDELVTVATLLLWIAYFVLPDQRRGPLALHRSSTLMRWNEIVSQLGIGPQPAADLTPSFMSDVEGVVARILERNPSHRSHL